MRAHQVTSFLIPALAGLANANWAPVPQDCQWKYQVLGTFELIYSCYEGNTNIDAKMDMNDCLIVKDNILYQQDAGNAFKQCPPEDCRVDGDYINCEDAGCGSILISDAIELNGNDLSCLGGHTATATTVNAVASSTATA